MKYWKLKDGNKYLCGVITEGILMMDLPSQNDLIILNDKELKDLEGEYFIDEITLADVFFDDLIKVEVNLST